MTIRTMAFCILLSAASFSPLCAEGPSAGSDADVPDLETRIRNTGSSIPAAAIPAVPGADPAALPPVSAAETPPAVPPVPAVAAEPAESPEEPAAPAEEKKESPVSGYVRLGAGSPGTLIGELSVRREEGTLSALALDFSYASADGYGPKKAGTGFFDRAARASFSASSSWFADIALSDGTNGLQGKNPRYFALTRRAVDWSLGSRQIPLGASAFSLSAIADGSVNSAFAEGPSSDSSGSAADAATEIRDFAGYRLSPALALTFSKGDFSATVSGRYAYETARDFGESHALSGDVALSYRIGGMSLRASGGAAGDGGSGAAVDGVVAPFSLGFVWNPARTDGSSGDGAAVDGDPSLFLEELSLSGGITRERQSAVTLAAAEPLVETAGLSSYSADWTAAGAFALGMRANGGSALSARFGAEYRKSLARHGMLVLTDSLTGSSLVAVRRAERESFSTSAEAGLSARGFALSARYSGEWLDRLDRQSIHAVTVGARAFDRDADRVWEAGVDSSFALDHAEYPALSANGTVRPFRNFAVTLSVLDVLPLIAGEARTRNGLYALRSGELTLSAKMEF